MRFARPELRAGAVRPWGEPRGHCVEINELVLLLRRWLDEAGITVREPHDRLAADPAGAAPTLRQLREMVTGVGLTPEVAGAIVDVCSAGRPARVRNERLEQARELCEGASTRPTPLGADPNDAARTARLVEAQDVVIAAYELLRELEGLQTRAERVRLDAHAVAQRLYGLLGALPVVVAELTREGDALVRERAARDGAVRDGAVRDTVDERLKLAVSRGRELEQALRNAELQREQALRLADEAARAADALRRDIAEALRRRTEEGGGRSPELVGVEPDRSAAGGVDSGILDDCGAALRAARRVLARPDPSLRLVGAKIAAFRDRIGPERRQGWAWAGARRMPARGGWDHVAAGGLPTSLAEVLAELRVRVSHGEPVPLGLGPDRYDAMPLDEPWGRSGGDGGGPASLRGEGGAERSVDGRLLSELADWFWEMGHTQRAELLFRDAVVRGDVGALVALAERRRGTGDEAGAREIYREAAARSQLCLVGVVRHAERVAAGRGSVGGGGARAVPARLADAYGDRGRVGRAGEVRAAAELVAARGPACFPACVPT